MIDLSPRYSITILFVLILVLFQSCSSQKDKDAAEQIGVDLRLFSRISEEALSDFFRTHPAVDESSFRKLYQLREQAAIWVSKGSVTEYGHNLYGLMREDSVLTGRLFVYGRELDQAIAKTFPEGSEDVRTEDWLRLELLLSALYLDHADRIWGGCGEEMMHKLGWFIPGRKMDAALFLDSILRSGTEPLWNGELVYEQYDKLKKYLGMYTELQRNYSWDSLIMPAKDADLPSRNQFRQRIYERLKLLGDAKNPEMTDSSWTEALGNFCVRHGLRFRTEPDVAIMQALNVSPSMRIRQILINMERCRWMPSRLPESCLLVNIPEFMLHVYSEGKESWNSPVIVGKSKALHHTVIFRDEMEFLVFAPYWNIPDGILKREVLPDIRKNPDYLRKHRLEVVDHQGRQIDPSGVNWNSDHFPYILRQLPGEDNALGRVKFLFPNPYNMYMHDTPNKDLFLQSRRDFSHGCIRLSEPERLVRFLLRNDKSVTEEKIEKWMHAQKETYVKLKTKVPVWILYFTSWVDESGKLHFRKDLYGHDGRMEQLWFGR